MSVFLIGVLFLLLVVDSSDGLGLYMLVLRLSWLSDSLLSLFIFSLWKLCVDISWIDMFVLYVVDMLCFSMLCIVLIELNFDCVNELRYSLNDFDLMMFGDLVGM